jgi:hypothetical protein
LLSIIVSSEGTTTFHIIEEGVAVIALNSCAVTDCAPIKTLNSTLFSVAITSSTTFFLTIAIACHQIYKLMLEKYF